MPGLADCERYSNVEAVRYSLLRLEGSIAPYTRKSYRLKGRREWLKTVQGHSLDIDKSLESLTILANCLVEIEAELMEGLGDLNSSAEQAETNVIENTFERDLTKRIYSDPPDGLSFDEFLKLGKIEEKSPEGMCLCVNNWYH